MLRPQGYAVVSYDDGRVVERDTFTCAHCQRVVFVKPRQDPATLGGWCGCCSTLICSTCEADGRCTPFEKRLEEIEEKGRRDRMWSGVL